MESLVRCFRRVDRGKIRRGVWAMTQGLPGEKPSALGVFFHGDKDEAQAPAYDIETLVKMQTVESEWDIGVVEITPAAALAELQSWPEAKEGLRKILEKWPREI